MGAAPSLGYDHGMDDTPPIDPDTMTVLKAYAARPRGNRTFHAWTVDELLPLLDPTVPAQTIAARLGVAEHVVTYELVRMRRAGLPVPLRPKPRTARTLAIEADLRAGMPEAEVARRHGVGGNRVAAIRGMAGIAPPVIRVWTDDERTVVTAYGHRPVREVADVLGRPVRAVYTERQNLMRRGLLPPKIARPRMHDDFT